MTASDPLSFLRSMPCADVDISKIKGNISDEEKQLAINVFAYFISTPEKSYGADIGRRLKMVEMNVWKKEGSAAKAQTICEIEVVKDMCNVFGTLHGACAAYIMDPCSVSSLVTLGIATGIDSTGLSQSMNLVWHQPIRVGTNLRVVATSVSIDGRVRTARCELRDKVNGNICVSAVHSTVNPRPSMAKFKTKL